MSWEAPADPTEWSLFWEAIGWFLERTPVTADQWDQLTTEQRRKAFTVSGVAQIDVINDVFQALASAVASGSTLDEFKKRVGPQLRDAWQGAVANPAWRIETIFRTNVQQAYAAGRHAQMTDPAVAKARPFWQFDAIMDNRVTTICAACNGTILPADSPWWASHQPPLHFNCRSTIRTLRKSQAERKGVTSNPTSEEPPNGFGAPPGENDWKPNLAKYPPKLQTDVKNAVERGKAAGPLDPPDGVKGPPGGSGGGGHPKSEPEAHAIAREITAGRRSPTAEDAKKLRDHVGQVEFNKQVVSAPKALRGLPFGDKELGAKAPSDVVHLLKRTVDEEQWARGTTLKQYLADLHTHARDVGGKVVVYRRHGGLIIGLLSDNRLPEASRGLNALPFMFIVDSMDREAIISGYQVSSADAVDIPEDAIWLP